MTASKFLVVLILTCTLLLVDWYVWQAVKVVVKRARPDTDSCKRVLISCIHCDATRIMGI